MFNFLRCRSGTKGKCGEVDPVFAARVSSSVVQSINTDQGQNSGRRDFFYITDPQQMLRPTAYIMFLLVEL